MRPGYTVVVDEVGEALVGLAVVGCGVGIIDVLLLLGGVVDAEVVLVLEVVVVGFGIDTLGNVVLGVVIVALFVSVVVVPGKVVAGRSVEELSVALGSVVEAELVLVLDEVVAVEFGADALVEIVLEVMVVASYVDVAGRSVVELSVAVVGDDVGPCDQHAIEISNVPSLTPSAPANRNE